MFGPNNLRQMKFKTNRNENMFQEMQNRMEKEGEELFVF